MANSAREIDIFSNEIDIVKLHDAVRLSHRELLPFRNKRELFIREFVSPMHGDNVPPNPNRNNNIRKYVDIVTRLLAPGEPRVVIDTFTAELRSSANSLQQAVNRKIIDIDLGKVLEGGVMESLYTMGIVKVGLNHSGTVEIGGLRHNVSEPFAEVVEFDDFTWDLEAKRYESCQFVADRVNIPLKDVKTSGLFSAKAIKEIEDSGSLHSERNAEDLPTSKMVSGAYKKEPFRESIDIWNVWMPFENRSLVILDDDEPKLLRDEEYYGPEHGPYSLLGMSDVPGNVMPAAPIPNLYLLHKQGNSIYAKTARQTDRSKTIGVVRDKGTEDGIKIQNARDGQIIGVQDPESLKEATFGGANPGLVAMQKVVDDTFNKNAGNIEQVGGLSQQGDTLGQEKLLSENASVQFQGMANRVDKFAKNIVKSLSWFVYDDPTSVIPIKKEVPGVKGVTIFSKFGPEERTADFIDYEVQIQPYSLNDSTPQQLVNAVTQLVTQIFVPMQPELERQGLSIDLAEYATFIGDMSNLPVLSRILVSEDETILTNRDKGTSSERATQAPVTERHNFRHQVTPEEEFNPVEELQSANAQNEGGF